MNKLAQKTFLILSMFNSDHPLLEFRDLVKKTGIPASTLYRFMHILLKHDYLVKDSTNFTYRLGPAVFRLARVAEAGMDFRKFTIPWLDWLWEKTGETIYLSIPLGKERLCIERRERKGSGVKFSIQPGETGPIYAGASGKVLLAFMNPSEINTILSTFSFLKVTNGTIIRKHEIIMQLADIRERGYAYSEGEYSPGAWALAAPILDSREVAQAALAFSGILTPGKKGPISDLLPYLFKATQDISRTLGYSIK